MIYPLLKVIGSDYSIGVVTYVKRFDQYFKPLVGQLEKCFPGVEKNYVLNGFYDPAVQAEYVKKAKDFLKDTSAANVVAYNESQSLSKCFNQLILHSSGKKILILNDDINLRRPFRWFFEAQMWPFENGVVNNTWSLMFLSKKTIKKVGWFDERFPAIGMEDMDYGLRIALVRGQKGIEVMHQQNIYCFGVTNIVAGNTDPGWKKDSAIVAGAFAQSNKDYFEKKWETSSQPLPGSIRLQKNFFRVRAGMETPKFYNLSLLDNPLKSPL